MIKTTKIAAAQLTPVFLNKEQTVGKACSAISEAGKNGAKLIVFPEAFISGYPDWVWLYPPYKSKELGDLYVKLLKMLLQYQMTQQKDFVKRQNLQTLM
jgi:nitrilase